MLKWKEYKELNPEVRAEYDFRFRNLRNDLLEMWYSLVNYALIALGAMGVFLLACALLIHSQAAEEVAEVVTVLNSFAWDLFLGIKVIGISVLATNILIGIYRIAQFYTWRQHHQNNWTWYRNGGTK